MFDFEEAERVVAEQFDDTVAQLGTQGDAHLAAFQLRRLTACQFDPQFQFHFVLAGTAAENLQERT